MSKLKALGLFIGAFWSGFKSFWSEHGLEVLIFGVALGNADVMYHYLIQTGSANTWQLLIAVYCLELLVVWASLWRTVGLFISFVLFCVSMVSIRSVFGENALGHSGFSIAIMCGSLGNYVRRGHWRELSWLFNMIMQPNKAKSILNHAINSIVDLSGMTVNDIRVTYNLTLAQANKAKQLFESGIKLTVDMMKEL